MPTLPPMLLASSRVPPATASNVTGVPSVFCALMPSSNVRSTFPVGGMAFTTNGGRTFTSMPAS